MRRGLLVCAVVALAGESRAAGTSRSRFEPTDLELERPGTTEVDLQTGVLYGDGPAGLRLALVDFELDLGLLPNVELDVDGAFSLNNLETPTPAFAGEALWTSVKLGFLDRRSASGKRALALGAQLGPRIATLGTYGVGYEGLGLFGVFKDRTHLVFNAGATLDPGPTRGRVRPFSLETGLDLDLDLDTANRWSFLSELAFAYFPGGYVNEVTLGAGFGFSPGKRLSMSIIALGGFVAGADRIGLLLGVAPKTDLW